MSLPCRWNGLVHFCISEKKEGKIVSKDLKLWQEGNKIPHCTTTCQQLGAWSHHWSRLLPDVRFNAVRPLRHLKVMHTPLTSHYLSMTSLKCVITLFDESPAAWLPAEGGGVTSYQLSATDSCTKDPDLASMCSCFGIKCQKEKTVCLSSMVILKGMVHPEMSLRKMRVNGRADSTPPVPTRSRYGPASPGTLHRSACPPIRSPEQQEPEQFQLGPTVDLQQRKNTRLDRPDPSGIDPAHAQLPPSIPHQ